jgi:hypothetical protein
MRVRTGCCVLTAAAWLASGCSYDVGYRKDYVPAERPPFVASGKLLIVMPEEQYRFEYKGPPSSETGDFTTLEIPVGEIVTDIARDVFGSCFAGGVVFANDRFVDEDYVLAVEGDMKDFMYRYTKVIDRGFDERNTETWIVPEIGISFDVRAYSARNELLLDKTYDAGVVAGEPYQTALHPAERINRTLHATLHELMLRLAADIRPLLIGECKVTDLPVQH